MTQTKFYKLLLIFTVFFQTYLGLSQNIVGRVFDKNKQPLEGVMVYLDNTSIITYTNNSGNFILNNPNHLKTNVVFRLIGYNTFSIDPRPQMLVMMQDNIAELDELVINKSKFSRAELLKVFKEQFLGTTNFGKNCKILNENDIELEYDTNNFTLQASSSKTLKIFNPLLGYNIDFDLKEFKTEFKSYTLDSSQIKKNIYLGNTLFTEVEYVSDIIKNNRIQAYKGSVKHFLYNLYHGIDGKDGLNYSNFDLKKHFYLESTDHDNYHELKPILNKKMELNEKILKNEEVLVNYLLSYNKKESAVNIKFPKIFIDKFGNYSPIENITLFGDMATHRLGNLLPLNFEFKNDNNR